MRTAGFRIAETADMLARHDDRSTRLADEAERSQIVQYLSSGVEVLKSEFTDVDAIDRSRGQVVGSTVRTDGMWVWSDRLTYYVREHGLAPEVDLRERIANRGVVLMNAERLEEVRNALRMSSVDADGVWRRSLRFGSATWRGRNYLMDGIWVPGETVMLKTWDPIALACGLDVVNGVNSTFKKLVTRDELSDAYCRVNYMVIKGWKIPFISYRDGRYFVDNVHSGWEEVLEVKEHDRGWWVGSVLEDKVDEVFAVNEHYPVGPGWRDRPAPEWIEPVPMEEHLSS